MHLLEQYALSCGLKIGKPFLYDHFYPLPNSNKYITIQKEAKFPSRTYKYWQSVIDLLYPILKVNWLIRYRCEICDLEFKTHKELDDHVYAFHRQ